MSTEPNPEAAPEPAKSGITLIAEERKRQVHKEGWTPAHDDGHASGELNDAAIAYAWAASKQARGESLTFVRNAVLSGESRIAWPWEDSWWKPSASQLRNLVKAGALIAAEIDRLQRSYGRI